MDNYTLKECGQLQQETQDSNESYLRGKNKKVRSPGLFSCFRRGKAKGKRERLTGRLFSGNRTGGTE